MSAGKHFAGSIGRHWKAKHKTLKLVRVVPRFLFTRSFPKPSKNLYSQLFAKNPVPMAISTLDTKIYAAVNDAWVMATGYERSQVLGRCIDDFIIGESCIKLASNTVQSCYSFSPASTFDDFWLTINNSQVMLWAGSIYKDQDTSATFLVHYGFDISRQMETENSCIYSGILMNMGGEAHLVSIIRDIHELIKANQALITEQKNAEAEVKYLSFHDKLTGLYNRAYFEEELNRLDTERQLPISLIMGDVNGLKLVNDALGHQEGDKLLTTVANTLKEACRSEDIVARWGGDEFILLLPACTNNTAAAIVERIKKAETSLHRLPIQTSISLGTATKTKINEDIRDIIKEAEDKMYRNKLLENRSTRSYFISSLETTLWSRSHETRDHCERIQKLALKIGRLVGIPVSELDSLKLLATLHDIGKIAIPNSILNKPGRLNPDEWEIIKKHPEIGYRIALSSPEMSSIAEAILHHHERWDGEGYPLGLRGKDIPYLSRIIAIVDAFDVMINGRPYQAAVSPDDAWNEIERCAGTQFDPDLVQRINTLFLKNREYILNEAFLDPYG